MNLKIYKMVRRSIPVSAITRFKWKRALRGDLEHLSCTCCQFELGKKEWAIAWINDGEIWRGARLCFNCGKLAEIDFKQWKAKKAEEK